MKFSKGKQRSWMRHAPFAANIEKANQFTLFLSVWNALSPRGKVKLMTMKS